MAEKEEIKAAIFAIERLRLGTDGKGITTLVAFMDCPLKCKYCLNDQCHDSIYEKDGITVRKGIQIFTPVELYEKVKIDNIYFCATGGGICFGGGEPGLQWKFIKEFRKLCGVKWNITIETSLCYSNDIIKQLAEVVNSWIVDIKAIDSTVFEKYTRVNAEPLSGLKFLNEVMLCRENAVTIKVPIIPNFVNEFYAEQSKKRIQKSVSFRNIELVQYVKRNNEHEN